MVRRRWDLEPAMGGLLLGTAQGHPGQRAAVGLAPAL